MTFYRDPQKYSFPSKFYSRNSLYQLNDLVEKNVLISTLDTCSQAFHRKPNDEKFSLGFDYFIISSPYSLWLLLLLLQLELQRANIIAIEGVFINSTLTQRC